MKKSEDNTSRKANLSQERLALLTKWSRGVVTGEQRHIPRRPDAAPVPLTFAQERLWFLDQLAPGSAAYNIAGAVRLRGWLHVETLEKSLNVIVQRHEALRTCVEVVDGQPFQKIAPQLWLPLQKIDLSALSESDREAEVKYRASEEARRPFDLYKAPLMRATLLLLTGEEHVLLMTMHHIVSDGWSLGIFIQELSLLYSASVEEKPISLPALPIQYGDFACWQRQSHLNDHLTYWKKQLAGSPSILELPTSKPRPAVQTQAGARQTIELPALLTRSLGRLSQNEGTTLFMVLLAALQLLLYRYTGETDILVGTPVANRSHLETEKLIGLFMNTLVLRTRLSGNPTVSELLARVREVALEAYAHQELSFEQLIEALELERDLSHSPLFQVMFMLQNAQTQQLQLSGLSISPLDVNSATAKFDITIELWEKPEGLYGYLEYNTDLFEKETITRMIQHYYRILEGMAATPEQHILDVPLLTNEEKHYLLDTWNATEVSYPQDVCIHTLFEAQVARTPDAIAIHFQDQQITFRELDQRANQLANYLRHLGVGPEILVGLCLERSITLLIAMLAILKAGGAYVPLDPTYPTERLVTIVRDSQILLLVSQRKFLGHLAFHNTICLDDDWEKIARESYGPCSSGVTAENLAYVIFTSGSTGRPKGVQVTHGNVVNFFTAMDQTIGCGTHDSLLAVTSVSFDISVLELFWTLTCGARIFLLPEQSLLKLSSQKEDNKTGRGMEFSLFYFASAQAEEATEGYRLLIEGAKFADSKGFSAVWTPERHFHEFGGLYPNPSVASAALAMITQRVALRAGSVVLPLHHPMRVAEEWSLVDNLSQGRVGIAFASGWHADDFVFAPDAYSERKEVMLRGIEIIQRLWRGEAVGMQSGSGRYVEVELFPRPVQKALPIWLTSAGSEETFIRAGERGMNVLTHLLGQDLNALAAKIALYREALARSGYDPRAGKVTLMLHTFLGEDREKVREIVYHPFKEYLRSSVDLIKNLARSLDKNEDVQQLSPEDTEAVLSYAFERYFQTSALFGTPESCLTLVNALKEIGVDELACLIDFGVDTEEALKSLEYLDVLRKDCNRVQEESSLLDLASQYQATLMQCTPSFMQLLAAEDTTFAGLQSLRALILGGEALPAPLGKQILRALPTKLVNMYGPTETTVWSATHEVTGFEREPPIGRPIANTKIYIMDSHFHPVPVGVVGEIYIGGAGVSRGYLQQPGITAERFLPNPFSADLQGRLYKTGDLARYLPDGTIEFVGRTDQQVKIRGYRVELGEIEAALSQSPDIRDAAVVINEGTPNSKRLIAYIAAKEGHHPTAEALRSFLKGKLPDYMVPSMFIMLDRLPLTPNGKINRQALPLPNQDVLVAQKGYTAPRTPSEKALAHIWSQVLGCSQVGIHDNFFELGGDSILSIQVVYRARKAGLKFSLLQFFNHQTIAELANSASHTTEPQAEQGPVTGPVLLTPIQHWFFEQQLIHPHHFNQAVMLDMKSEVDIDILKRALQHVFWHHDALRLRFFHRERDWLQLYGNPDEEIRFGMIDVVTGSEAEQDAAIEQYATELQGSLDLSNGPIFISAFFRTGQGKPDRFVMIVNHLVMDGVSWRILLEDIETAYHQLSRREKLSLPPKTTSFQTWAQGLKIYAQSEAAQEEAAYWLKHPPQRVAKLPLDNTGGENTEASASTIAFSLGVKETSALLQKLPSIYHSQINDILLTALSLAFSSWTGENSFLFDVEGHGREDILEGVDISRTVGWFTSLFPTFLGLQNTRQPVQVLELVRQQLRMLPKRGIGYGILRYLSEDAGLRQRLQMLPQSEVMFNYLGQVDQSIKEYTLFKPGKQLFGPLHSTQETRRYLLEINSVIVDGCLELRWTYSQNRHHRSTIEALAEGFIEVIQELVAQADAYI